MLARPSQFSSQAHKLLLVGIVEEVCRVAVVHEVPGIARCFVEKAANANAAAHRNAVTEGVNLRQLWQIGHGIVDLDRIGTNDIGAILRTYGVEAARSSIINEMSGVFSVYGIGVDYRHLTIIADYMVRCRHSVSPRRERVSSRLTLLGTLCRRARAATSPSTGQA